MDFLDLKVFAAVAEEGGIGKAARRLNTVQSNVTARIRLLEEQVGMPLLLRHSRGTCLTRAGERLLPHAQQAVNLIKQAKIAVRDDGEPVGSLRLGAVETSAAFRVPPLMSRFVAQNPSVQVDFETGPAALLIESVLDQKLDGAFVVGPTRRPELVEIPAFREELWLWTSRQWPSLQAYLEAAASPTIVAMRAGCSYRAMAEDYLRRACERTFKLMELATLEGIIGLVAAGLGIALLPRAMSK
jgi:DNA-binding transcriptional LysR family regulator